MLLWHFMTNFFIQITNYLFLHANIHSTLISSLLYSIIFTIDAGHDAAADVVPYAEHCAWNSGKRILLGLFNLSTSYFACIFVVLLKAMWLISLLHPQDFSLAIRKNCQSSRYKFPYPFSN